MFGDLDHFLCQSFKYYTERQIKVCTWLRDISSCSCLNFMPGPAWLLLNKICTPLFRALYKNQHYSSALLGGQFSWCQLDSTGEIKGRFSGWRKRSTSTLRSQLSSLSLLLLFLFGFYGRSRSPFNSPLANKTQRWSEAALSTLD